METLRSCVVDITIETNKRMKKKKLTFNDCEDDETVEEFLDRIREVLESYIEE